MVEQRGNRLGYTGLIAILMVGLVIGPHLGLRPGIRFALEVVVVASVVLAVRRLTSSRMLFFASIFFAVTCETASLLRIFAASPAWVLADQLSAIALIVLAGYCITRNVWFEDHVTSDTIVGGIVSYILLALVWSNLYQMVEFVQPGSFAVVGESTEYWGEWSPTPGAYPRLFFFSFVTLTTLGYGDIVPASPLAASLAVTEAVAGPIYLTVLIARIVGLYTARTSAPL